MSRSWIVSACGILALGLTAAWMAGAGALSGSTAGNATPHGNAAAGGNTAPMGPGAGAPGGAGRGPVVVELFTSQGCSSCPPADRLLSRLKRDPRLAGAVIPLAFHVDYWNHLGWSDPFSSAYWSRRQEGYAQAFRSNRIYTPQLVVNGRTECVGSQEGEVLRRIKDALAAEPAGQVSLAQQPGPNPQTVRVTVSARILRPVAGAGSGLDLWVALTESGLTTAIGAGENAQATLHDDQVVRRLVKAFSLPAAAGAEHTAEVVLPIDHLVPGAAYEVAAFLQDPRSLAIEGAASRPIILR
jgi:hypothetical protein